MNLTRDFPDRSRRDAAHSIFALMIVCIAFVTTAVGERLAGPSFQADCVYCIDDAKAAAGQLQGPTLAADAESRA